MDIRNTIKNNLASQMAKVGHINKSKDHTELKGMVSEKKVKITKDSIYEILDEVTKTEGDLEEIRLNPFGSNIKDIEKVSKDFIKVLNKKMPKLRIKHVERLNKLLSNVESEIRNAKNKYNTDKVTDNRDEVISKIKSELEEITGAASAGGFLGPLFSAPIKRTGPAKKSSNKKPYNVTEGDDTCGVCGSPVEECKCEGHKHDVDEQKGHSPYLVSDENPTGETDGLTSDILTKILSNIAKTHDEDEETHKIETKEATLSSSSGSYETPFFLAKNKKNWRGAAKTLYKGGQFVKVKDKCKTFPYCNQGDIKALELFEGYDELAEKVAKKMGEDSLKVKSLVLNDLEESLFQERMKELNKSRIDKSEKNNRLVKK